MAQLNNVPEISGMVSDLSDLMEASIGRDDRLITIEEEFTYADKYISLQRGVSATGSNWSKTCSRRSPA